MASPFRGLAEVLTQLGLHPNRAADVLRMAEADPAMAHKLMEAAEAQDFGKSLRTMVADSQWGSAPARPARVRPESPAPLTTAQRMMANPDIQTQIQANMGGLPPELVQRLQAGDPDAAVEAYQMIAAADGALPPRGVAQINDPDSPDYIPDVDMMGFSSSSLADDGVASLIGGHAPPATRQMELPLGGENALPPRGLIPFGARGPGVPTGGPTGMGTARDVIGELVPAPLRGIPGSVNPSFGLATDVLLRRLSGPQGGRPLGLPGPPSPGLYSRTGLPPENIFDTTADTSTGLSVIGRGGRGVPVGGPAGGPRGLSIRAQHPGTTAGAVAAGAAAGAGGFLTGLGAYDLITDEEPGTMADDLTIGGAEALAAETSPPPVVTATSPVDAAPAYPAWKRVIDDGHVPLGDATPGEIAAANRRITNMIDMGMDLESAKAKAYEGLADGVVARAKRQAEAWLQANPGY